MTSIAEARIAELTQGMLRKTLYVVLSKGAASLERIRDILPQHLEYMIDLERKGLVFASARSRARKGCAGTE